jgi:peptidoglycan-associated lipoprotein
MFAAVLLLAACGTASEPRANMPGQAGAGRQEKLFAAVGDRVFFDFDTSDLTSEAHQTIQGWSTYLKEHGNPAATIEGYCDERGTQEYNIALGERRATAIRRYLISLGVEASRVSTISYGKEHPAVAGSNEGAWSQNRRGVLVIN